MPLYIAPYEIARGTVNVPTSGTFTVPVCTTPERFSKIMDALFYGSLKGDTIDYDHLVDWLDACTRIEPGCVQRMAACRSLSLQSSRVTWFPESPYAPGAEVPAGYLFHPYTIVDDSVLATIISQWGLGYKVGDVYTDITKIPPNLDWSNLYDNVLNMPYFEVNELQGSGVVKLHFLNIPQGGRALIQIDDNLNPASWQIVELNKDLVSFPQETQVPIVVEVEIPTEGTHKIRATYYPSVDDAYVPIFFGGGLRAIELCGFGESEEDVTDNCCDETNSLLSASNAILSKILTLIGDGFKIVPINGIDPADEIAGGCSPFQFDAGETDEGDDIQRRKNVLCFVTRMYVIACVVNALPSFIRDVLGVDALFDGVPAQIKQIRAYATNIEVLFNVIIALLTDGVTLDAIACEMIAKLQGKVNSRAVFEGSVAKIMDAGLALLTANNMVVRANQDPQNYKLFNELLVAVMDDATLELSEACNFCGDEPIVAEDCGNVSLVDVENTGCTFEYLGGCLWRITQPNVTADNRRWYSFADANGLTLYVNYPEAPYETPHVAGCEVGGACGDADYHGLNYGGGFVPGRLTKVLWWNQSEYSPSAVLKIEAYTCP